MKVNQIVLKKFKGQVTDQSTTKTNSVARFDSHKNRSRSQALIHDRVGKYGAKKANYDSQIKDQPSNGYKVMQITDYVDDDVQFNKNGEIFGSAEYQTYDDASNEDLQMVAPSSVLPTFETT